MRFRRPKLDAAARRASVLPATYVSYAVREGYFIRARVGAHATVKTPRSDRLGHATVSSDNLRIYRSLKRAGIPVTPLVTPIWFSSARRSQNLWKLKRSAPRNRRLVALSFKTVMPLTPEKAVNKVDEIADILARLEHVKPIIEVKFSSLGLMQDRNGKERVVLRDWYPDLGKRNTEVNGDLSANPNLSKYVSLLATPTILASVVEKKLGVTRAQKFENDLAEACERLGLKHDPAKERRLALKR